MNRSLKVFKVHPWDLVKTTFGNGVFELNLKNLVEKYLIYSIASIDLLFKDKTLNESIFQNTKSCVKIESQCNALPYNDIGVRLFCNRALVWCLAGIDYENLVSMASFWGFGLCTWSPTIALHVFCKIWGIEAALMCLDWLGLPSCARNPHVGSSISFVKIIKENVFLQHCMNYFCETTSGRVGGITCGIRASREGTFIDEPSRTTSSSSSSLYSLREIVPEREPIPVIDLFDDESVEGPKMAPVAPGIGLGTSIEEDPSEPTSDSQMTPELERVAPAATIWVPL
ncbi:hypothetical protein M9H77_18681 [Catharanthus roseus]|uniref:Uncharacterized protein n=1 Tax=Catharanthus roseus TaxID=4058 RepID=A0ACC0B8F5_CATRO|nr:hypothetical protein M9H77_18681 [Catharanthus roseus]